MTKLALFAAILILAFTGCASGGGGDPRFATPGFPFGALSWGDVGVETYPAPGYVQTEVGSKTGIACATRTFAFPFFFFTRTHGDTSVQAAARMGKITRIKGVSYMTRNYSIFTQQVCTVVNGD